MHIVNIDYHLADKYEYLPEAATKLGIDNTQAQVFERLFGLKQLPLDPNITVEALMLRAIKKCLTQTTIKPCNIKWIIHAHTANQIAPFGHSAVANVQRMLGMTNALAFGSSLNKCGSVFMAFDLARILFQSMAIDEGILIVTSDVSFTKVLQFIPGTTITTDGAAAILLSKLHQRNKLISLVLNIYGEYAGGFPNDVENKILFEKHYKSLLVGVIKEAISRANLRTDDIKLILPHNVNTLSWYGVLKELRMSTRQIFLNNISKTAHCFGADPFINFRDAQTLGLLEAGDYFIFATVGLGATFAAMIFQH